MTQLKEKTKREEEVGNGYTFLDPIGFLKLNWRFLTLLTLALSAIAVTLTMLVSEQYSKQLSLSVTPVQSELLKSLEIQPMTVDQVGSLAQGFLQDGSLGQTDVNAVYTNVTQQVQVTLQSSSKTALEGINPKVIEGVETQFQEMYERSLNAGIEAERANLKTDIENQREALDRVEESFASPGSVNGEQANARLQALENTRASTAFEVALDKNELGYLEGAQRNLLRLATEPISVEITQDSGVTQSRPLIVRVALAVAAAFALAILVTILRAVATQSR